MKVLRILSDLSLSTLSKSLDDIKLHENKITKVRCSWMQLIFIRAKKRYFLGSLKLTI